MNEVYWGQCQLESLTEVSTLQGVGLYHRQQWLLIHHPALSHTCTRSRGHPRRASSGLLPRCCCSSRRLYRKRLMPPQRHRYCYQALQMTWALTCFIGCCSVISPVQFIVQVNSQVLVRYRHLCLSPGCSPVCRVVCACGNPPPALWSSWRWAGGGSAGTSPVAVVRVFTDVSSTLSTVLIKVMNRSNESNIYLKTIIFQDDLFQGQIFIHTHTHTHRPFPKKLEYHGKVYFHSSIQKVNFS